MNELLTRADFGWLDIEDDIRYVMDDYGNAYHIPFCAPRWAAADFEVI